MLVLLLCSLIVAITILSFGHFISTLFLKKQLTYFTFFEVFLVGFVFLNTYYSAVSIFYKTALVANIWVYLFTIIYLFYYRKKILCVIKNTNKKQLLLGISIALFFCICATIPPMVYDSGLYHIQAIKWIEEYGIVKGLGNLHGRIAFNPNIFTLFAGTSFKYLFGQSVYCINYVLFTVFVFWQIYTIQKIWQKNINLSILHCIILLVGFCTKITDLSSPSPDLFLTIIPLYIFLKYIELKTTKEEEKLYLHLFFVVLITYTITVKLVAIPLLLFIPFIVYQNKNYFSTTLFTNISVVCVLIVIPWLVRNYYLSGYLIYPFPAIDIFHPIWKMPIKEVITEKIFIQSYAWLQIYDIDIFTKFSLKEIFLKWWNLLHFIKKTIFIIVLITPFVLMLFYKHIKIKLLQNIDVYFVAIMCFIFWFVLAPDFRFGNAYIFICTTFLVLCFNLHFLIPILQKCNFNKIQNYLILGVIVLSIFFGSFIFYFQHTWLFPAKINKISNGKKIEIKQYLINGKTITYPIDDDRCFDEVLPCSNIKKDNIEIIGNEIKNGFKPK